MIAYVGEKIKSFQSQLALKTADHFGVLKILKSTKDQTQHSKKPSNDGY
jgi:hypothetical protein